jgi:peptidyl-prolyl cis-trans isomerase A (cyclophilin A)
MNTPTNSHAAWPLVLAGFCGLLLASCESKISELPKGGSHQPPPEQAPVGTQAPVATQAAQPTPPPAQPTPAAPAAGSDPLGGKFALADAIKGLTGKGDLIADIKTAKGQLECKLYDDKAPITVANFVGLARGLRPWKNPAGEWVKTPAYDGTTFHRVVKGFMVQGGDPAGNGTGEPGYVIPDEIWAGAKHDQRGFLCMANRGPNTNGMQFFITDASAPHLDGNYTIFGKCGPDKVIEALASVPVQGQSAVDPPKIEKVTIRRGTAAAK